MSNSVNKHFDAVGSYLRPAELKEARAKFANNEISAEQLRAVEDRLIEDVIRSRRPMAFITSRTESFAVATGTSTLCGDSAVWNTSSLIMAISFMARETTKGSLKLTGKITGSGHPFIKDFLFVKQFEEEGVEAKLTIPAPAQFLAELFRGDNSKNTREFYPNNEELIHDIAEAYRTFFREIHAAGCNTVQLDDCTWGMIVDDDF